MYVVSYAFSASRFPSPITRREKERMDDVKGEKRERKSNK